MLLPSEVWINENTKVIPSNWIICTGRIDRSMNLQPVCHIVIYVYIASISRPLLPYAPKKEQFWSRLCQIKGFFIQDTTTFHKGSIVLNPLFIPAFRHGYLRHVTSCKSEIRSWNSEVPKWPFSAAVVFTSHRVVLSARVRSGYEISFKSTLPRSFTVVL